MERLTIGVVSFPFECCIEGKERSIARNGGWHDVSAIMVMLRYNESAALTVISMKEIGIIEVHDDCA